MNKTLFNDFPEVSAKQWKQQIQADLKGADYNETLIHHTNEGIDIKPFYNKEDIITTPKSGYTQATAWLVNQAIFVYDIEAANAKAVDALNRGAESITFVLPKSDVSLTDLFKNIDLNKTPLYFELQFLSAAFIKQLNEFSKTHQATFYITNDIIGNLAKSGNWHSTLQDDHAELEAIIKNSPNLKSVLAVDISLYQNAGANMVQQLAYAMAHCNEYLNHFTSEGKLDTEVTFKVSAGTNYFFEIAKLRALRLLWESLANEYSITSTCNIIAQPTKRNKTLYDYNTNMLRTTTECMSAVLGGANAVCNLPYDAIYHKDNEFGDRIARNQLLVLKNESYLDKVNNPADGSYYIEYITQQLAEKALELFKDLEANGGFLKQLKEGTIQRKIKESATKEQEQFNEGKEILLGTNKHPNPDDKMKGDLELYPFFKTESRKTLIEPIIEKRLAEAVEQKRLEDE
ncbi:methylmalonyl-CoA mutase subunit beta [Mangrovimonas aestuarii]|uniref:methylmalonyl-CoA mutase subunit beta n=1 Tax=Mangrovimonas aestuarii TaxID=3018443 RepID=UPI0023781612|nr:methylmalonyl-CoA mutase subunit beta [Mangrovimonas aestuarii]